MSILKLEGAYENELAATGEFNPQAPKTALMLPSGQRVVLPTDVLLAAITGVRDPSSPERDRDENVEGGDGLSEEDRLASASVQGGQVIPLIEEQMQVSKAQREIGRVRVHRETEEHVQTVSVPLTDIRWEVDHVPVEKMVETQPEIRQVGETIVFPLVEERMVVKRELWLREEVHVRKVTSTVEKSADFPVKRDVLIEERTGAGEP